MKTAVLFLLCLALSSVGWAQGGPDDICSGFCEQVKDYSCTTSGTCTSNDCESILFTAPCRDESYLLKCEVVCTSGDCQHCKAVVCITDDGGTIQYNCTSIGADCEETCGSSPFAITLSQNQEYKLWACLQRCGSYDCADCANCRAVATLYRSGATCPSP